VDSLQLLPSFVVRRLTVGRVQPGANYFYPSYFAVPYELPTVEKIAKDLLADAEFQSLKLGNWLNSPSGEVIAQIVAEVIPSTLQPEFGLIVDGLKLAADLQQKKGRGQIGLGSMVLLGVGILIREGVKPAA
jgi:hypothetical protein